MTRRLRSCVVVLLAIVLPCAALAQRGGRPPGGGGVRPSAPMSRPAPPPAAARPAPVTRTVAPAPAPRPPAPSGGGFNFQRDLGPRPAAPAPSAQRVTQPIARGPGFARAPFTPGGAGPNHGGFHGRPIANPHPWNGSWGWNRGVAWTPVHTYWGGGFWGGFALAALGAAVLFGAIDDQQAQLEYPSYQVLPDSPGALLLQNYGLQQTPCGPPGLVVIWGPDNSVICAFPNQNVGPGNYGIDFSTLTLISQ